eukprot:TRINITY_DN799_c0_g1_i9.p1 TRINITY_DN799_c0_g1~~TRINITY_DN799_c0_g1_i9.p1  ORF type:complete len:277 (+),score=39.30 TRINITY_DN799_c0_g1_i9:58-888(+)
MHWILLISFALALFLCFMSGGCLKCVVHAVEIKEKKGIISCASNLRRLLKKDIALPESYFHGMTNVHSLHLSRRNLVIIPERSLHGLMHLQRIDFSNNRLSCLPERLFQGLANVRSISLSGNQLSDVPEGIFDGLINLRTLDLSDNQLVKIPEGLLHGLEYLNSVSFSNNKLTALEPRMLCGCENLEYLCVSGNYGLATPQIYTWRGLKSLKRMYHFIIRVSKWQNLSVLFSILVESLTGRMTMWKKRFVRAKREAIGVFCYWCNFANGNPWMPIC